MEERAGQVWSLPVLGHQPVSTDLGRLGTRSILPVTWAWMLTQISLTHLSPVSSPSHHHMYVFSPGKR